MKWRCAVLCLVALGFALSSARAEESVQFVDSPFRSLSKTRQLLDAADLRILLPLGYELQPGVRGRMSQRQGVVEQRIYAGEGGRSVVEIALVTGVAGGYEFALYGGEDADSRAFSQIVRGFEDLARKSQSREPQEPEPGYEMYRLGHIEADRALGLLKALGYHTVEFAESSKTKGGDPILELVKGKDEKLPWIIRVANASKTSLLQADGSGSKNRTTSGSKRKGVEGAPQLGGSHLHSATTGAPEERLLLVYDRSDPEALEKLVNLLQTHIDVPAQQIVIEALVIEVNTNQLRSLGVELSASKGHAKGSFERQGETSTSLTTFLFSRDSFADFIGFKGSLEALAETGDAKILSSPSVLVINDRQARIQVGRQIPIVRATTPTLGATVKGIEYFPIGIVLNLRPRINRENTEVTMQIETIISSISTESAAKLEAGVSEEVEFAPIIENRVVETYVRVADGTPFIIGGLLSTEALESEAGVPLLSDIPILGHLFSRQRIEKIQREVIVVITPHIVPLEDNSFSYLIPKDADMFDRFDFELFRNAYRVRDDDIWDLKFVRQSPVLLNLLEQVKQNAREDVMLQRQEPIKRLLEGRIPGEEVLVRRMLYEIVGNLDFSREIDLEKVFVFTPPEGGHRGQLYSDDLILSAALEPALKKAERALVLAYEARPIPKPGHAFSLPLAMVRDTTVAVEQQKGLIWDLNIYGADQQPQQWAIVLANKDDVERLRRVLILKHILNLNKNLPQTLQAFRPGVQILFPTREDMRTRYHPIDRDVARLFYETQFPYQISERMFNQAVRQIEDILGVTVRSMGGDGR